MNTLETKYGTLKAYIISNASYHSTLRDLSSTYFNIKQMEEQLNILKAEKELRLYHYDDFVINGKTYKSLQVSIEPRYNKLFVWFKCTEYNNPLTDAARTKLAVELSDICRQFYIDHFDNLKTRELTSFLIRFKENLELIQKNTKEAIQWADLHIKLS